MPRAAIKTRSIEIPTSPMPIIIWAWFLKPSAKKIKPLLICAPRANFISADKNCPSSVAVFQFNLFHHVSNRDLKPGAGSQMLAGAPGADRGAAGRIAPRPMGAERDSFAEPCGSLAAARGANSNRRKVRLAAAVQGG